MLTLRHKLEIAGALLALAVIGIIGSSWISAREDGIRLKATLDAQQTIISAAVKREKDLQSAETERDRLSAANIAALQQAASRQITPAQIAAWIPKQLGSTPLTVQIPPATAQNPSPDAIASIPQASLPALRDQIEKCQECALKLSTAQSDLVSKDERLRLAGEQVSALGRERDAAVTAAKGGSKWSRMKRSGKWFVIGAAAGAIAAKTTH
jgi:hypothetical protein